MGESVADGMVDDEVQSCAGNNIVIGAEKNINLLAARSTDEQHSTNKSSSGSIGISIGTSGFGVTASASAGRGNADGSDVTWTNTHVNAGNQLALVSGSDVNLIGAVASAKQVVANVAGDLNIESLQDTSKYDSKQKNIGGSVTIGAGGGGSFSYSKSSITSDYASVTEQSGIKTGDGGFQVVVGGNTDLNGAVIASTEHAVKNNKNILITASLTNGDIANHADASAKSSGVNLSSDMLTQGKYGVAKGLIGTSLNNGELSGNSTGITRSAVESGAVVLTDEDSQLARTGMTINESIASLNRDTSNAHNAAQKQDVQAMLQAAEAEKLIKQAIFVETTKFSDEAYRTIFVKKHPMFEIIKDADGKALIDSETGKIVLRELSDLEKENIQPGSRFSFNGIFNDQDAAGGYANQHAAQNGPHYLIHFPEAEGIVPELLVAAYQNFLESDFLGVSNSTAQAKELMNRFGASGLILDGHSRGAMTIGNALESQAGNPGASGSLSQTLINFYGPAYNAAKADGILSYLQNREALSFEEQKNMGLKMENHFADLVGTLIGKNPGTGGSIPEGSSFIVEALRVMGGDNTVHNCYKSSVIACQQFWK